MKKSPLLQGFDYTKVQALTAEQKDLVLEALGYALSDANVSGKGKRKQILETFVAFTDRGLII